MSVKLRGIKRRTFTYEFDHYRTFVDMPGQLHRKLAVIDMQLYKQVPVMVFVHGYAGVAESWEYQLEHFAASYRVIAPDLRGHGHSDAPYTRYDMPELVNDLHSVLNSLKINASFTLIGHSFGGAIAAEYAIQYPEHIQNLILISAPVAYPLTWASWIAGNVPTPIYRLWWRYRPRWNADIHVMKRMLHNNMKRWQGWDILPGLQMATLLITGNNDTYFPRHVLEAPIALIPHAIHNAVPNAKHKVQLAQPAAVNCAINEFLADARSGPSVTLTPQPASFDVFN